MQLWRGAGTVALLAATGLAIPGFPSESGGLRVLALAGVALMLVGLILLRRVVSNWNRAEL